MINKNKLAETVDFLNLKTDNFKVDVVVVLGSGLSGFTCGLEGIKIKYSDIPNFKTSNVLGHKGELLFCKIGNKNCAIMQGRFHYYEGNSLQECVFPIYALKMLGAKYIFITNAAGAINLTYDTGDIVLINDHINFIGNNPLIGKNDDEFGTRFPDMSDVYNQNLRDIAKNCSGELNINIKEGVYLATSGPSYETKAEIKMFRTLGADVVGMSSVPEAIVSNYLNIKTIAFSLVTNKAAGIDNSNLDHNEVIQIGKTSGLKLSTLIKKIIEKI